MIPRVLPQALIITIVIETIALLTLGVLLVALADKQTISMVVGIILLVLAILVAATLAFPDALRYMISTTKVCDICDM